MAKNDLQEVLWYKGHTLREWKRVHGCEKIAKVGRGMKEGAVLKKLFTKNLNSMERRSEGKVWKLGAAESAAC